MEDFLKSAKIHKTNRPSGGLFFYSLLLQFSVLKYNERIKGVFKMAELFNDKEAKMFFEALMALDSVEDCRDLFLDLCTIKELESMIQRYQVARMLSKGKLYTEIVAETGASTATISRVNRSLSYGNNGYKKIIAKCGDGIDE